MLSLRLPISSRLSVVIYLEAQKLNADFSTALGVGAPNLYFVQGSIALINNPLIFSLFFTLRDVHLLPLLRVTFIRIKQIQQKFVVNLLCFR